MSNELAENGLEFDIHLVVGPNDVHRRRGIQAGEGIQCLAQHVQSGIGHVADADAVLNGHVARPVDAAHTLGNLWPVAGAFQVGDDLADPEHQAQVGGGGLALGEHMGAVVVDGLPGRSHLAIRLDDGFDAGDLARVAGPDGVGNLVSTRPPICSTILRRRERSSSNLLETWEVSFMMCLAISPCGR